MTAQTDAEDAMKEAVADAAAELKIAGLTVKSVGTTYDDNRCRCLVQRW